MTSHVGFYAQNWIITQQEWFRKLHIHCLYVALSLYFAQEGAVGQPLLDRIINDM